MFRQALPKRGRLFFLINLFSSFIRNISVPSQFGATERGRKRQGNTAW